MRIDCLRTSGRPGRWILGTTVACGMVAAAFLILWVVPRGKTDDDPTNGSPPLETETPQGLPEPLPVETESTEELRQPAETDASWKIGSMEPEPNGIEVESCQFEDGAEESASLEQPLETLQPREPHQGLEELADEPGAAEPSVAEPSVAEPSVAEPAAAEPAMPVPGMAESVAAEPAMAEPAMAEPAMPVPAAAEPAAAELALAEPEAPDPEAPELALAEPEAPDPEAAELALAEPEAPDPVAPETAGAGTAAPEPAMAEPVAADPSVAEPSIIAEFAADEPPSTIPSEPKPQPANPRAKEAFLKLWHRIPEFDNQLVALFANWQSGPSPYERRRGVERLKADEKAICVSSEKRWDTVIKNLSVGGAELLHPEPVPRNTRLALVPPSYDQTVTGRVSWVRENGSGFRLGLNFEQDPETLSESWVAETLLGLGSEFLLKRAPRRYVRVATEVHSRLVTEDGRNIDVVLCDVSLGGCLLQSEEPFQVEELTLRLGSVDCLGKVVNNRQRPDEGWSHHVTFAPMSPLETLRLLRTISSLLKKR